MKIQQYAKKKNDLRDINKLDTTIGQHTKKNEEDPPLLEYRFQH